MSYLKMNKPHRGTAKGFFSILTKNRTNSFLSGQIANLPLVIETYLSEENVMYYFITIN